MALEQKVYTIGKGKLLFKEKGQTNFHDFGNCTDFKVTTAIDKKEHYSSRSGTKTKDAEKVIQQTATGSFTLDDLLNENLRIYLMAIAVHDVAQSSGSAASQAVVAELDKWIDLGKLKISNVVVTDETDATTYVLGTDYELDTEVGLIRPLSGGNIGDGDTLHVSYDYADVTTKKMSAASTTTIEGHIYFVADPPAGKIADIKGYVALSPKGDLSTIGDDFTNIQFDAEFLSGYGYGESNGSGLFDLIDRGTV
jgi:hypothetical protein